MISNLANCQSIHLSQIVNDAKKHVKYQDAVTDNIKSVSNESDNRIHLKVQPSFNIRVRTDMGAVIEQPAGSLPPSTVLAQNANMGHVIDFVARNNKIYKNAINEWFLHEKRDDVRQSLQRFQVSGRSSLDNITTISTHYYPQLPITRLRWCGDILVRCREEIIHCSDQQLIPDINIMTSISQTYPGGCNKIGLDINNSEINNQALGCVFKAFYNVFKENHKSEKFFVAVSATALRNYWYNNPPQGINRSDIMQYIPQYADFFKLGDAVINTILKKH